MGFTAENTIFGHSLCPDSLNHNSESLGKRMEQRWGESVALGGLAGVPFAGLDGWIELKNSVPDNGGKVVFLYATHVSVTEDGTLGKTKRPGQQRDTTACKAS